ncbi:helix-turn-helix domain-containing protein [Streptomyces sp. NBC_01381]|uniref:helix-turn-helix domain-containing protein n=1 Tax=Streptomyces sp. NBC_01381 TaxID=2903845 RepID=UPI00224DDEB7|nr:helix-turn-helix transcriptional regulator [Streptomyces sp. NBC_01381]MCX4671506.1 helix-turn-helix domain-containing protein [Streptomyces sp. NBC_01381]
MTDCNNSSEPEPNDSLQTFGAVLQGFREHAGLTQQELAPLVGYSAHFVASVEQGRRLPPEDFVERAEVALNAHGILRKAARKVGRQPGLAAWFRKWAGLEELAISLYTYECRVVPGLLQTAAYARTLFDNRVPLLTDDQIETQLTARQERQRMLRERQNTAFCFILDEHVLLRRTGGTEVADELTAHLLDLTALRNVEIQVMPLSRGVHAGMNGPMRLLEVPENQWFGYIEGQETGQLISEPKTISVLQMRYAKLRSQALTPEDSVSLLKQPRGAL